MCVGNSAAFGSSCFGVMALSKPKPWGQNMVLVAWGIDAKYGKHHQRGREMMQGFLKRHLIQFNVLCLTVHGLFNHY